MNANDHVPMVHILPFGLCKKGMPCMPVTPLAWVDVNKKHIIEGAPALTEDSKLACFHGGVITIVPLDAGSAEEGKMNEIVESAVEKIGLALKMAGAIADCIDVFSPGGLVKMAGKKGAAKKLKDGGNKGKGSESKSGEKGGGNGSEASSKAETNWKSVKQYGHTFNTHGSGAKNTKSLTDRAKSTGNNQGQWTDNPKAADYLNSLGEIKGPTTVSIPEGLGRVITPNGEIVPATRAIVVPSKTGIKTAYPIP